MLWDWKIYFNSLRWLAALHHFLSSFLFFPVSSPHSRRLLPLSWTSFHPLQLLCDMGHFRQTEAMLFGQRFLLNGPSFIFTHGAFPVPEQLYTWLHLELKEQAEFLSPAKEQQHCDSYRAVCLRCSCLHSQSKKREYYFVLMKWPRFRQEKLTQSSISILHSLQNHSTERAEIIIHCNSKLVWTSVQ